MMIQTETEALRMAASLMYTKIESIKQSDGRWFNTLKDTAKIDKLYLESFQTVLSALQQLELLKAEIRLKNAIESSSNKYPKMTGTGSTVDITDNVKTFTDKWPRAAIEVAVERVTSVPDSIDNVQ